MKRFVLIGLLLFLLVSAHSTLLAENSGSRMENLAFKAKVSAKSEFNAEYAASGAVDGVIPPALSAFWSDTNHAWAIRGSDGYESWFRFDWDTPQTVGEVVYFGRTGVLMTECF